MFLGKKHDEVVIPGIVKKKFDKIMNLWYFLNEDKGVFSAKKKVEETPFFMSSRQE